MSGPDPLQPIPNATELLRTKPEDTTFEADFADLAARFAASSGGGLSSELSVELALEIVLNEVVEQACLATGATGAAIVLARKGDMICRATNGATAPELGSRLDTESGLSGLCVRSRRTERCDDVLTDPRVDVEASARLGIRSVMVMPLLRGDNLVGLFELFSPLPNAFGERDEKTLEVLARRVIANLEHAEKPVIAAQPEIATATALADSGPAVFFPDPGMNSPGVPSPESEQPTDSGEEIAEMGAVEFQPKPGFDFLTTALGISVIACAVLLGILLGQHYRLQHLAAHRKHAPVVAAPSEPAGVPADGPAPVLAEPATTELPAQKSAGDDVPPGGMRVFENGKEIFRMRGPGESGSGVVQAASRERLLELSPALAANSLVRRVEPEYPESVRKLNIQGAVVLDVQIATDGSVQNLQTISGPAELVSAATDAVKQWRFKARSAPSQTRVTLNFRLQQ